ncbi:hypothetical protein [Streptomyces sp. NPDC047974]|uniref:hypothetical protein n=1 Tax=Streptomyces sp. NPDC047974 TaxID=3154343 RepID=UPI0033F4A472
MTVWLISAGGSGDPYLPAFREHKAAVFSYKEGGDISSLKTQEEIAARFAGKPYLDQVGKVIKTRSADKYARELIKIRSGVERGDYLYTPLKGGREFLIGRVKKNPYEYRPENDIDHRHILRTKWATPVLAAELGEELVPHLGTHRHTIRTPKEQQALTAFADRLFA